MSALAGGGNTGSGPVACEGGSCATSVQAAEPEREASRTTGRLEHMAALLKGA